MPGGPQRVGAQYLPFLQVEVMLVVQRPPQYRREFVERLEQFAGGLPQPFELEAPIGGTHVLEDALLRARGHNRLGLPLDEDVGALPRPAPLVDPRQTPNAIRAPVLSEAE